MENEKIKIIIRNMELLLNQLKIELRSNSSDYVSKVAQVLKEDYDDMDEIFEEDD